MLPNARPAGAGQPLVGLSPVTVGVADGSALEVKVVPLPVGEVPLGVDTVTCTAPAATCGLIALIWESDSTWKNRRACRQRRLRLSPTDYCR